MIQDKGGARNDVNDERNLRNIQIKICIVSSMTLCKTELIKVLYNRDTFYIGVLLLTKSLGGRGMEKGKRK